MSSKKKSAKPRSENNYGALPKPSVAWIDRAASDVFLAVTTAQRMHEMDATKGNVGKILEVLMVETKGEKHAWAILMLATVYADEGLT